MIEAAKSVPDEQLDALLELLDAACLLDATESWRRVQLTGKPPVVH